MTIRLLMSLFWPVVRLGFTLLHKSTLVGFGYVIPALSSVRAVLHQDVEECQMWLTYFIILSLIDVVLDPLLSFMFHPLLKIPLILWLSLPRYQGARLVYDGLLKKHIQRHEHSIDFHMDRIQRVVRQRVLQIVKAVGMEFMHQLVLVALETRQETMARRQQQQDDESGAAHDIIPEESKDSTIRDVSTETRDPQHSVRRALSSFASFETATSSGAAEDDSEERRQYVQDFVAVLSRGIYVFSHLVDPDKDQTDDSFELKVLSFEREGNSLLLSSVGPNEHVDEWTLQVEDIGIVRSSGSQAIILGTVPSSPSVSKYTVKIVLSDSADRDTLLQGLLICLPELSNASKLDVNENQAVVKENLQTQENDDNKEAVDKQRTKKKGGEDDEQWVVMDLE